MTTTLLAALSLTTASLGVTEAELDRRMHEVRARIADGAPDSRFHVIVESPFIVIGDGTRKQVKRRAHGTVRWAVGRLKEAYFAHDPEEVIAIWLFKDRASYQRHTWALFGDRPDTPFGYFSPRHRALIMNIGTGGGTLTHELVHPLVDANIPDCPAWLNEGLGSLYEQASERDGAIVGLTNWRLPGLQEAIRVGALPTFTALMRTSEEQFYAADPGTNYGQSRYLLYYLQEQGLLRRYVRRFMRDRLRDPSGVATLRAVLGRKDLTAFQRDWQRWVTGLRYPPST